MVSFGLSICAGLACWLQMATPDARWLKGFGATAALLIFSFSLAEPGLVPPFLVAALSTLADTMILLFLSAGAGLYLRGKTKPGRAALIWGGVCFGVLWLATP